MTKQDKKDRFSGIEILKVIAFVLVILDHTVEMVARGWGWGAFDVSVATGTIAGYTCLFMHYLGMMSDVIFITCSAWFLVDNNHVNKNKIIQMLGDKYFIPLIFLIIAILLDYSMSTYQILLCFSPNELWFVMCYILYYSFHPYLNVIINSFNKKTFAIFNTILICLYCGYSFIITNWFGEGYYCRLLGFFVIYFIVAYLKKYMQTFSSFLNKNIFLLCVALLGQLVLLYVTDFMGMRMARFSNQMLRWDTLINPFSILVALAMLNIFNKGTFVNKKINYFSSLSLLVYMFHANIPFREIIAPKIINYWTTKYTVNLFVTIGFTAIFLLFSAVGLSILYKIFVQKIVYKLSKKISEVICNIYFHILDIFLKIN